MSEKLPRPKLPGHPKPMESHGAEPPSGGIGAEPEDEMSSDAQRTILQAMEVLGAQMSALSAQVAAQQEEQQKLNKDQQKRMEELGAQVSASLTELGSRVESVSRTVRAIETLPVPYGRPKSFVSATEFHSVSKPIRVKQGYQG